MSEVTLTIATSEQMRELGRALAGLLRAGDLVILSGGLGAGKTTLTKGIGDGLGVRGPITSPTFVIARVHPPLRQGERLPALVHADAYRLGGVAELDDLDLDADTAESVTVVEWGEGLAEGLADDRLEIVISPDAAPTIENGDDSDDIDAEAPRIVQISAVGERWNGIELPVPDPPERL